MKSAAAMDVKTEADGLTIYSEGLVTEKHLKQVILIILQAHLI